MPIAKYWQSDWDRNASMSASKKSSTNIKYAQQSLHFKRFARTHTNRWNGKVHEIEAIKWDIEFEISEILSAFFSMLCVLHCKPKNVIVLVGAFLIPKVEKSVNNTANVSFRCFAARSNY